jgi:hypothetical protein
MRLWLRLKILMRQWLFFLKQVKVNLRVWAIFFILISFVIKLSGKSKTHAVIICVNCDKAPNNADPAPQK